MDVIGHSAEIICDISEALFGGEIIAFYCFNSRDVIFAVAKKEFVLLEQKWNEIGS